jgi:predicted alpha/beta superfamily hydrolase
MHQAPARLGVLTVLATIGLSAQQPPAQQPPQQPAVASPITLESRLLEESRRTLVRLPRRYEQDKASRYPVLYKLDGDNGLDRYHQSIDVLHTIDLMPDVIVVAIPNGRGARNRDLTPSNLHQDGHESGQMGTGPMGNGDRFLDFIERELIPYIEKNYRTTSERLFAGHSRGALLVLRSLILKPDLFRARFLFSAPLMRDEQRMLLDTRKFLHENAGLREVFLYCNWGESENEGMTKSHNACKDLLSKDAPKKLRWAVERAPGADHQQTPLLALPRGLAAYFAGRKGQTVSSRK